MKIHYILIAFGLCGSAWAEPLKQQTQTTPEAAATTTTATAKGTEQKQATAVEAKTTAAKEQTTAPEAAPQATATTKTAALPEQSGFSRGSVIRSVFTTGIQEREPIDKLNDTAGKSNNLFYFTELRDMSGQTATHRWEFGGKVVSEVKFSVRGPRWRVWSSKAFTPGWAGEWKVSVLNGAGETISEDIVNFTQPEIDALQRTSAADAASATDAPAAQEFEPPVAPGLIE